jgi:hypothetical protein
MFIEVAPAVTYIEVPNPDVCHTIGQFLALPWSMTADKGYRVERDISELPQGSLVKRVAALAMCIFFWQISLPAFVVGMGFLLCSKTYRAAFQKIEDSNISITWTANRPEIETQHLVLRPITADDLPAYLDLFRNPIATQWMEEGARYTSASITAQFNQWLNAWEEPPFSALAVVDKRTDRVIGHAMLGIGAFEAPDQGYAQMSMVIDPAYWNRGFENGSIGEENRRHIGSEVARALVHYAKDLKKRGALMSVDVPQGQVIQSGNVHLNADGVADRVYLPLTEIRAFAHRESLAAQTIGERMMNIFGAIRVRMDGTRDRFTLNLA